MLYLLIKQTPLSAVCVNESGDGSEIVTHTYLFATSIINQSNSPAGYPSEWSPYSYKDGLAPADYEMDQEVTQDSDYKDLMTPALKNLPSYMCGY